MQPPTPRGQPAPAPVALQPAHTTTEALIVGLRYAAGEGALADRGDATLTTYRPDGSTVGNALSENNAEYNLYTRATDISEAYPAARRPAPSAVFELLRFGRVIGPDALTPNDVPHWRQVHHAGGQGWVNLNAANVHAFSDADFPHWKHWALIDDSADGNSRCDSAVIRGWLDGDSNGTVSAAEAQSRMSNATVAPKLAHAICKFPTEWNAATIDARWGWLKVQSDENPMPLSNEDFEALRRHIAALTFWPGGMGIDANHWHWQPREFVRLFRGCGWLGETEFAQCLPRQNFHLVGTAFNQQLVASWQTSLSRSQRWAGHLSTTARKYIIPGNKQRLVHFLSQCVEESGYLQFVVEGDGANAAYAPWYGRGLIQLTHLANYQEYGRFRGWGVQPGLSPVFAQLGWDPDQRLGRSDFACADSAGFYWICTQINAIQTHMNSPADAGISVADVLAVSRGVNGNVRVHLVNGLDIRIQLAVFLRYVLMDDLLPSGNPPTESVTFTWRNRSRPRPLSAVQHTLNVILTPQRP
jgi:predicted chitinase